MSTGSLQHILKSVDAYAELSHETCRTVCTNIYYANKHLNRQQCVGWVPSTLSCTLLSAVASSHRIWRLYITLNPHKSIRLCNYICDEKVFYEVSLGDNTFYTYSYPGGHPVAPTGNGVCVVTAMSDAQNETMLAQVIL